MEHLRGNSWGVFTVRLNTAPCQYRDIADKRTTDALRASRIRIDPRHRVCSPKHVTTAEVHTLVGVFRSTADAYKAVNRLDDAKVAPDHVSLIAGDAQLAADVGGRSLAIAGTLGGMALGIVLAVLFIFGPGGSGWSNPVGLVIGSVFVVGGLGFIGFVVGQALVVRTSHQNDYEHAVEEGGAVVAVSCRLDECDRARAVLRHAGAANVVDEMDADHL